MFQFETSHVFIHKNKNENLPLFPILISHETIGFKSSLNHIRSLDLKSFYKPKIELETITSPLIKQWI